MKVAHLSRELGNALNAFCQQSNDRVVQTRVVFQVQSAGSLNCLELDFDFKCAKVSNEMKNALENCNIGAHHKVTKCMASMWHRLGNACRPDANDDP